MPKTRIFCLSILVVFHINGIFTAPVGKPQRIPNVNDVASDPPSNVAPLAPYATIGYPGLDRFNNFILAQSFPYISPQEYLLLLKYQTGLYPFTLDTLDPWTVGNYAPTEIWLNK
ncbi:hypothetical protein QE152_g26582 [Popillia japonica]|uniref:Uncharacterized protein n=1 Tax=Popillia japonica TaxID=7064 RepID=A0AAW1JXR4_POPJA